MIVFVPLRMLFLAVISGGLGVGMCLYFCVVSGYIHSRIGNQFYYDLMRGKHGWLWGGGSAVGFSISYFLAGRGAMCCTLRRLFLEVYRFISYAFCVLAAQWRDGSY